MARYPAAAPTQTSALETPLAPRLGAEGVTWEERDLLTMQAVLGYRAGPREVWAPVLLRLLDAGMTFRLRQLHEAGSVSQEDLRQQFVVEVLGTALAMPIAEPRYLQRRILLRAGSRLGRWLKAEATRAGHLAVLDEDTIPSMRD